jgi:tetratricopeptide (TPR) repeat protein
VLPTANKLQVSEGQKVVFQQTLVPPSEKPAGESGQSNAPRAPTPSRDPYARLSPLELSAKADAAYSAGRYDEAEKLYAAVLSVVSDDPGASKRLKEISGRRQQAEKLKNADFFLTRGDDAYKAGDYALAASYYIKVSEVDETYRDAGAKYWLSKALAAKAKGDATALREANGKLKEMTLPESLGGDLAGLGLEGMMGSGASETPSAPKSSSSTESAEPYFEKAVSLNLEDEQALLAQGQNYLKAKQYDKAIPSFKAFLEITKNENYKPAITGTLAGLYVRQAQVTMAAVADSEDKTAVARAEAAAKESYSNALVYFDKLLVLRPNSEIALEGKANALIKMDKAQDALAPLKQFLQASKNEAEKKKALDLIKMIEAQNKQ